MPSRPARFVNRLRILTLVAALAAVTAAPAQEMKKYTNKSWRWSLSYPAGWTVESDTPGLVRVHSFSEGALCTIHSGPMDRFNTADELTAFLLEHDEKFLKEKGQKFTVLKRQPVRLANGVIGNNVLVEIGPGGRSRRLHALADGGGFAVDCEGYTKNWERLDASYQRIISSFTVAK